MPLHPQVKTLLDTMAAAGGPSMDALPPEEARALYDQLALLAHPEEVARVDDRVVPGLGGDVPVRVYTPAAAVGAESAGVLVWFHGGGWVVGNLGTADATCRALANRSGAVVVSVDYRLAPEHPAPAALDDCMAALTWTVENAEVLGVDLGQARRRGRLGRRQPRRAGVPARAGRVRSRRSTSSCSCTRSPTSR